MAKEQITHYEWPADSIIRRIDVRTQSNGRAVAYLYADNSEEAREGRKEIRAAIRLKGWGTLSDHRDGEFALRVSGLNGGQELIDTLVSQRFVGSAPSVTQSNAVEIKSKNAWEFVRNHSLSISGVIATVGNAMSFSNGVHRMLPLKGAERKKAIGQIGQGVAFAIADLPLAIAGERDDSRQLSNLLRELKNHYERTGIEIPKTASINAETSDQGKSFGTLAKDYLHRYANQIKCSFEVVAAGFTIHAGKNQDNKWKKYAPFIWGPGFLASLLIPEKKIDEEKYAHAGMIERAWMNIQSNPLSIGGLLGYSNTVATYMGGIKEREKWKAAGSTGIPYHRWEFATPTVMIGANGTYAISKKTVGGDIRNDAMVSDIYSVSAQILNKQPEGELRDKAIESTASFLSERPEISDNHQKIIARLREEMQIQRQNPWFETRGLAPYTPQPKKHKQHEIAPEEVPGVPRPVIQRDGLQREGVQREAARDAAPALTH